MVAPLLGDLCLMSTIVLVFVLVVFWVKLPSAGKLLLLKSLGRMRDKTLNLMCYDDGVMVLEAQSVSTEGLLESGGKKGESRSFFLGMPMDDTADVAGNVENKLRDRFMLPLFSLDGFPVGLSYMRQAVVSNPHVVAAMQFANFVSAKSPTKLKVAIKVPAVPTAVTNADDAVVAGQKNKRGLRERFVSIWVALPIDPKDIQRNFHKNWSEDMMHSTKMRYKNIGAESNKKDGERLFKMMFIGGIILCIGLAVVGLVVGRVIV
jgi:hypothetical protein